MEAGATPGAIHRTAIAVEPPELASGVLIAQLNKILPTRQESCATCEQERESSKERRGRVRAAQRGKDRCSIGGACIYYV